MTSRRQQHQDNYDHILPFIQEAADEYYGGNIDRGFRHWAFATFFVGHDMQGNDIIDYTAIDGADDFEIDGYFIPESDNDSVVYLFQSKRRAPGTGMGASELAAFLNAPNRILNVNEVGASRNEETKTLHDRLVSMLATSGSDTKCSLNLVWVTSGALTQSARNHARENYARTITTEIHGRPTDLLVTLECFDLSDLRKLHDDQRESGDSQYKCDHVFHLEPDTYHHSGADAEYRTLSMTVPVKQIIDVFARHSYKIFRHNPRGPLGNTINNQIKDTLNDPVERKRFHLLNNGLTAICEAWQLVDNELHVRDFQIINGCQTTSTLWNVRAAIVDDPAVLVTVKLTECPLQFAPTIARTTNSQATLRAEDLVSNDDVQLRLQREFMSMTPPWFYQIKRGEWGKILRPSEKEAYRDPAGSYRQIASKDVAQAAVAFAGYPGEAKDRIRNFLNKETVPSFAREDEFSYAGIYSGNLSAIQLLLPSEIQRKVWKQVAADKEADNWLDYARSHIIWLIGDSLREHYGIDNRLFSAQRSASVLSQIDGWFYPLYTIAVAAIRNTLEEMQGRDERALRENPEYPVEFRGYREFFRSANNYRAMESNRRGAYRMASALGNPSENLPK